MKGRIAVCVMIGLGLSPLPADAGDKPVKAAVKRQPTPAPEQAGAPVRAGPPGRTLALSLADAVFVGLRKNTTIRSAYVDRVAQVFNLKVAEDVFTPKLQVDGNVLRSSANGVVTDSAALSPSLQVLTPVGTTFGFIWDNTVSRSPTARNSASTISAVFNQPLLRGGGLEVNLASVQAARFSERINQLTLKGTVSGTITDIITAYRALLSNQENLKLADEAVRRSQATVEITQALIEAGRVARTEIVQAQADLESQRLNVLLAQNALDQARLALSAILDLDLNTVFVLRDRIDVRRVEVAFEDALEIALKSRPDYASRTIALKVAQLGVVVADNQRLPDLSVFGAAALGRSEATALGPSVGALGASTVRTRVANASVGVRLSAPINDLTREQGYISATTGLLNTEISVEVLRRTVEQQIRQSVVAVDLSWRQVEVARRLDALAGAALDIEKQKLAVGRSSTFQVTTLASNYALAKVQVLNAEVSYANTLTALDLQLGTTIDTWKIKLRTTDE